MIRITLIILILLAGIHPASAEPTDEPVYEIELLAFERPGGSVEEDWPEDPGEPDTSLAAGLLTPPVSKDITPLPTAEGALQASAYALQKKGLTPLLHLRWQQKVAPRSEAKPYWVQTTDLKGLIKVGLGRYLHLDIDLLLNDPASGEKIRVTGHRRMRSRELHHLDHPRLGLLVIITPVEQTATTGQTTPAATDKP